jgi:hypothetical protein
VLKVEVYWNFHRKCWSVRSRSTRRVLYHLNTLSLLDATFHVSEAGRQRVLRERVKNVHAYVRGTLSSTLAGDTPVRYNPYRDKFFNDGTNEIRTASRVNFNPEGKVTCEI